MSMNPLSQVVRLFQPAPQKPPENAVTWMCRNVYAAFYTVWNPIGRIRMESDGIDKSNKLAIALLNGCELYFEGACPRAIAIRKSLKNINDFIGGTSFLGRVDDVFGLNARGRPKIYDRTLLKATSQTFLMIAKGAEGARWLNTVDLLPTQWFTAADANLGQIASRIGQTQVAQVLRLTELGGVKDTFVVFSATYSILDNLIALVETSDRWTAIGLAKTVLSIVNDIGKIIMSLWFRWYVMTWTFVGVAAATSIVGLTKILLASYTEKKPFELPVWAKA